MASSAVLRILIFDKHYACRLDKQWNRQAEEGDVTREESMQLIMGMTYSLKNMLSKLSPDEPSSRRSSATDESNEIVSVQLPKEICFSYTASKYRLTYYESQTGWKIVLLTDPSSRAMAGAEMRALYKQVFVQHVVQNPIYKMDEPSFERTGLTARLNDFFATLKH